LTDKTCWFTENLWAGDASALYKLAADTKRRSSGYGGAVAPTQPSNPSKCIWGKVAHRLAIVLASVTMALAAGPAVDPSRVQVVKIVTQIRRADYGGDRAALNQLYDQLVPFVDEPEFASRVRYWRGFAKWRRAINGFGETPTPKDLSEDLTDAESEFDAAIQRDPGFVDAKIGAASCMFNRLFLEGVF
jgi:hypothetical protein